MILKILKFRNHNGQASTEYILFILVVAIVAFSVFNKLKEKMIDGDNSFISQILSGFENSLNNGYFSGQYKSFTIKR